jgi:Ni/Co efflux regulator RcnB
MMKIALAVAAAAAVLTTAPLTTPAKAQGVKMAQVDMQTGRHLDDRYDRDRGRRYDSDTTVGVGPGGVTVGPRQRCRTVTTTIEGDDGRMIRRKERRCD